MKSSFLRPTAICSWPLPTVDLTSSTCLSSLPGSVVCSVSCWANIRGWSWNKELALASHQPGISLALGLGRAVLHQRQMALIEEAAPPRKPFQPTCVPKREADVDPLKQDVGTQVWLISEFSASTTPTPCSSNSWGLGNRTYEAPVTGSLDKRLIHLQTLVFGGLFDKRDNGGVRVGSSGREGFPRTGAPQCRPRGCG